MVHVLVWWTHIGRVLYPNTSIHPTCVSLFDFVFGCHFKQNTFGEDRRHLNARGKASTFGFCVLCIFLSLSCAINSLVSIPSCCISINHHHLPSQMWIFHVSANAFNSNTLGSTFLNALKRLFVRANDQLSQNLQLSRQRLPEPNRCISCTSIDASAIVGGAGVHPGVSIPRYFYYYHYRELVTWTNILIWRNNFALKRTSDAINYDFLSMIYNTRNSLSQKACLWHKIIYYEYTRCNAKFLRQTNQI